MNRRHDIPREVLDVIGWLWEMEGWMSEEPRKMRRGTVLIKEISEDASTHRINVIPGGVPGICHPTLLVAIGYNDDVEKSILRAVEHINVRCPGITRNVLFWAASWNSASWTQHKDSFRSVTAVLKPFFAEPALLHVY